MTNDENENALDAPVEKMPKFTLFNFLGFLTFVVFLVVMYFLFQGMLESGMK